MTSVYRALRSADLSPRLLSPPDKGYVYALPLVSRTVAAELYHFFTDEFRGWRTETDAFGRQARATAYFGDEGTLFSYVGLTLRPKAWPMHHALTAARQRADLIAAAHGTRITSCLANHYGAGSDSIPWHSDEVRAHGDAKLVLSLSLGGERRMLLRPKRAGSEGRGDGVLALTLPPGSAVAMAGAAQDYWEHSLPLDSRAAPRRVSLTFRTIVPGYEEGRSPPIPC